VLAELGVSERRACAALGQHRSTQRKIIKTREDEPRDFLPCRSCGRYRAALYNTVRPHSSLNYRQPTPEAIIARSGTIVSWVSALALEGARSPNPTVVPEMLSH
jgi:transposase InsO family protein